MQAVMRVKGLLEMMFEVLSVSIAEFIEDIQDVEIAEGLLTPSSSTSSPDKAKESPQSDLLLERQVNPSLAKSGALISHPASLIISSLLSVICKLTLWLEM